MPDKQIYRQKSIQRLSDPEKLDDYLRVIPVRMWMLLLSCLLILAGFGVWSVVSKLDTTIPVGICTEDGRAYGYVHEKSIGLIRTGMEVRLGDEVRHIAQIAGRPVPVDDSFPLYLLHITDLEPNEWVYEIALDAPVGIDGDISMGSIIAGQVSPSSFIYN